MDTNNNLGAVKTIKFYRAGGQFGFLSNFSRHSITVDGKDWKTTEHYYQGQKFSGKAQEEAIRLAPTPGKAKKLGNERQSEGGRLRKDWSRVKEHVMYKALQAKFTQHPDLHEQLLATGDAILAEHTNKDTYWGDGGNGSGLNRLGALLMQLRNELRTQQKPITTPIPSPSLTQTTKEDEDELEEFSESDDGVDANGNDGDGDDEEDGQGELEVDGGTVLYAAKVPSRPTSAQKARKKRNRNRMRKDIWKDGSGGALFAKDNDDKGQVSLVNQQIQIPVNVLPAEAKYVIHQNQYRRRWRRDEDEDEAELADNVSDGEPEYRAPSKTTLGDFLGNNDNVQKGTDPAESVADYLLSPAKCVSAVVENISLFQALAPSDPSYNDIKNNLLELKQVLIQFVQQQQDDELMGQLLAQVEAINDVLQN